MFDVHKLMRAHHLCAAIVKLSGRVAVYTVLLLVLRCQDQDLCAQSIAGVSRVGAGMQSLQEQGRVLGSFLLQVPSGL